MKTLVTYFPLFIILTRGNFFRYVCTRHKTNSPAVEISPRS